MHNTQRPRSHTALVGIIVSAIVVLGSIATVLYFYRDILKDMGKRSTIGGCLNDVFQKSRSQDAPLKWTDGEIPLPTLDVHTKVESELPDDLRQFSFVAAVCCGEVGQDIAGCAKSLRGFVEANPEATASVSNAAPAIHDVAAAIVQETPAAAPAPTAGTGAPPPIQAVLDEKDPMTQSRLAYAILGGDDEFMRADALSRFYAGPSIALRRAAIIHMLEQTKSGKRKLAIEGSALSEAKADASVTQMVNNLVGEKMSVDEIDHGTGVFQGYFAGQRCDGTVSETDLFFSTHAWKVKLEPAKDRAALTGVLTDKRGTQMAIEIRLM